MEAGVWIALITSATSLVVASISIYFQRRGAREEREARHRSDAKVVLDKYRGPLLAASWALGDRIGNIRHRGFLAYLRSQREADARLTTMFRFAQYFGWREILYTESQLLRFNREADTRFVAALMSDLIWVLTTDQLDARGYGMLWAEEQRGIGELMIIGRRDGSAACRGYAAFAHEYPETFAPAMSRFEKDILSERAETSSRLRLLEWGLLGLVLQLDEERVYADDGWLARTDWMRRSHDEFSSSPARDADPEVAKEIRRRLIESIKRSSSANDDHDH